MKLPYKSPCLTRVNLNHHQAILTACAQSATSLQGEGIYSCIYISATSQCRAASSSAYSTRGTSIQCAAPTS